MTRLMLVRRAFRNQHLPAMLGDRQIPCGKESTLSVYAFIWLGASAGVAYVSAARILGK
ncbi:hypothetical protein FA15DRAFT_370703 [Coprinopsis marcescibilis]|uniref:Uncharacterized protein n=1 Tax=Coprinopsis marcescibilis TaxID=230819 RepID=A0A5C3KAC5_COPMA|nr:hypothetical protein FA15DRAFT_370703 [Coprinopsis marcescibilis]